MYGLLANMYDGTHYTQEKIEHQYSKEIFKEALLKKYITVCKKNQFGLEEYIITLKGKEAYTNKSI